MSKPCRLTLLLLAFLLLVPLPHAKGDDEPFVGPSNWGFTGLMDTPTARVLREDRFRIGAGQVHPYRYYYGAIGLLKGLEIGGRVTEVLGVKALESGYGNTKDKALDVKYQFWPEGKYSPALALGIMDPHGTRLYSGQFIVASKQLYPFDFTLGFGNGRFGKQQLSGSGEDFFEAEIFTHTSQWLKDGQFFAGIEFSPSPKYSLMVEYNPTKYEKQTRDPAQPKYFTRPVPLQYNFGFRWRPLDWTEIDFTYQRGNQFGINLSMQFDIGQPLIPIWDKPYKEKPEDRLKGPYDRMLLALKGQGFSDIGVDQYGDTLIVKAQNDKYFYSMRAVSVMLHAIAPLAPPEVNRIHLIFTENGITKFQVTTTRDDVNDLHAERMTNGDFFYLSKISTDAAEAPYIPTKYRRLITPGFKPSLQTFLNDPSGFFKYRLGVEGWAAYQPWKGTSLVGAMLVYPLNNISSSNIPPAEAVRSDIVFYKSQDVSLARLMIDQIYRPKGNVYTRVGAGLLETEYAGVDAEVAVPLWDGRIFVGLQGSLVKKRDPDSPFKMKQDGVKNYYDVELLNTRLNIPEKNMALDLKTGRFLGTDFGTRITLIKYVRGVTLFAWYSFTNTSVFKDSFNRGYHDKGIGVTIPMRLFEGTDTRTAYSYTLSPWTRDVAQDLDRYQNLFDFIGRDTKLWLWKDRGLVE